MEYPPMIILHLTFIVGHPAGHDGLAVLPPPEYLGLRVALGLTSQVHPLLLPDYQVIGAPAVNNRGGNWKGHIFFTIRYLSTLIVLFSIIKNLEAYIWRLAIHHTDIRT